jgi:opacity protein-like surface antigen
MGDDLHIQLAYGRLVADQLEVALVAGLRDNDFYMSTELGVRAEYNFVFGSPFVPFLSSSAVWASVESDASNIDTDAAVFSVGAGAKYFLQNNVALALSGNYLMATDDIFVDNDDGKAQDDEFRILFSIRFYW